MNVLAKTPSQYIGLAPACKSDEKRTTHSEPRGTSDLDVIKCGFKPREERVEKIKRKYPPRDRSDRAYVNQIADPPVLNATKHKATLAKRRMIIKDKKEERKKM
jgi:hypothetical protein